VKGAIGSWIVIMAYVVVLYVLVRPGSQGPTFVKDVSSGISGIISASTGGGTWATT
jgi:hypothetical protein